MRTEKIERIKNAIEPLRQSLLQHPLYNEINSTGHLAIFMQNHVFAVWDFMSLLKALQRDLSCVDVPWVPKGTAEARRLINEIVVAEESDVAIDGSIQSHFEMYHSAMTDLGASTQEIDQFLSKVVHGRSVLETIDESDLQAEIRQFLYLTFETIGRGKVHEIAALFTFGREDLIPDMFTALVRDLASRCSHSLDKMVYYLERHIELDGDEHGPLAMQLIDKLCGDSEQKWLEVEQSALKALESRIELWNGIYRAIKHSHEKNAPLMA